MPPSVPKASVAAPPLPMYTSPSPLRIITADRPLPRSPNHQRAHFGGPTPRPALSTTSKNSPSPATLNTQTVLIVFLPPPLI